MNKQDMQGVRTPLDLERKYDLAAIVGMKKAVLQAENQITKINSTLEKFIISTLGSLENMQSQIDGNITTWFNSGEPKPETYPTNEWETEEEKINHIGDLYYDRNTGYAYRYESTEEGTYNWEKIRDNDVVEALAIANAAKDTADNKRRVFVVQPTPPYECGDLWITSEGEIYICQIEKDDKQTYAEKDFVVATKYTDDTYAKQVENQLQVVRGAVTTIIEGMDRFSVDIDTLENDMTVAKTQILANTSQIALSVLKDAVIAAINLSNENILIQAKKINLQGAVTMSSLAEDVAEEINEISDNATNAVTTANQAYSNVNAALTRATCHYGTCSTEAATVAKEVILNGFELYTGAQVSVKFINANTATNPTLNVNSTGAKNIRVNNANITSTYYWAANNTVTFVYDGTYWVMADSTANSILAQWCYNNNKTLIDGGNLAAGTVTADKINVNDLFAKEINATGSIAGAKLISESQYQSEKVEVYDGNLTFYAVNPRGENVYTEVATLYPSSMGSISGTGAWCFDSVETLSGANLDTINSNLTTNNISITGNNSYGSIVCKMKNNRVVLNGHIVTHNNISPNTYATIGTVEVGARPNVSTVLIVGVLGYDGVAQGMCIGEVTTNGEIIVKNTLNLYTRHFYFDAVWDV